MLDIFKDKRRKKPLKKKMTDETRKKKILEEDGEKIFNFQFSIFVIVHQNQAKKKSWLIRRNVKIL